MYFFTLLPIFELWIILSFKFVDCFKCYYYPNYPSLTPVLQTQCSKGCNSQARTYQEACIYDTDNLWALIFPILVFIIGIISFIVLWAKKKEKKCSQRLPCSNNCFKCLNCPSCPKFKSPFGKRKIQQSKTENNQNLSNQVNNIEININQFSDRQNNNPTESSEQISSSPPKYEDLMISEIQSPVSPNFDFPMPVMPESINQNNFKNT